MEVGPIRTDEDNEAAIARLGRLWGAEPGTPEFEEADTLAALIDAYENERYPNESERYITKVIPGDDTALILQFESGEVRFLDMKPLLETETWEELRDPEMFGTVKIDNVGGLEWDNGLLFSPDSAFLRSTELPLWLLQKMVDVYHDYRQGVDRTGTDNCRY
ncbi:MAG: DUF2442 domain-containing protein [Pseudomonadota bacterium]